MARPADTIAALATPPGTSALAVVRVSGPDTARLAEAVAGRTPRPRAVRLGHYRDRAGAALDEVLFTFFAGPHSYTGEDALEISSHGNPFIAQRILADLFARGCRPAAPGEFTQRAFLNGRMDLSQAEAVMDVIQARGDRALAAAQRLLGGALGRHLAPLTGGLLDTLARVEAYIDFPDEDLPAEDRGLVQAAVRALQAGTRQLLATQRYGDLLRDGVKTVIVGAPNVGKSSLLNRLVGHERALVGAEPGTTRDFIEERIIVGPHCLRLVDTAGLNPRPQALEERGIAKTREQLAAADLRLLVLDASRPGLPSLLAWPGDFSPANTLVVLNKADLGPRGALEPALADFPRVAVSALTGEGLAALTAAIGAQVDRLQPPGEADGLFINARHADALGRAEAGLAAALRQLEQDGPVELLASDLRGALSALGELAGKIDNERTLDRLFAAFCIGK